MPFKSKSQQRWMFAAEERGEVPKGTAKRWAEHTPSIKKLPEKKADMYASYDPSQFNEDELYRMMSGVIAARLQTKDGMTAEEAYQRVSSVPREQFMRALREHTTYTGKTAAQISGDVGQRKIDEIMRILGKQGINVGFYPAATSRGYLKFSHLDDVLQKMAELRKRALARWRQPDVASVVGERIGVAPAELETIMAKRQLAKATGAEMGPSLLAQERETLKQQNKLLEKLRTAPKEVPKTPPPAPVQPHPGVALRQKGFTPKGNLPLPIGVKPTRVMPANTLPEILGGPSWVDLYGTRGDKIKQWWRRLGKTKRLGIKGGLGGITLGLGGVGLYHLLSDNEKGASVMKKSAEQIAYEVLRKVAQGPMAAPGVGGAGGGRAAQVAQMKQRMQQHQQQQQQRTMQGALSAVGGPPKPVPSALTGGR